jgi:hypothetical protein
MSPPTNGPSHIATADVRRLLGELDDATITAVMALKPSLADLEEAAVCVAGNGAVLADHRHEVSGTACRILELLADDEEEAER